MTSDETLKEWASEAKQYLMGRGALMPPTQAMGRIQELCNELLSLRDQLKELSTIDLIEQNRVLRKDAKALAEFYGDPETWIDRSKNDWKRSYPKNADEELMRDYKHPGTDWVGSIVVNGKNAREFLEKWFKEKE